MKNKMFNLSLGLILFVSIGLSLGEDVIILKYPFNDFFFTQLDFVNLNY